MNKNANIIKNRLSLRQPQAESLEILSILADKLEMKKEVNLSEELEKVKSLYPTCSDFERTFPSICFALATGVGKTRLMGAFLSYLYIEKGIKNFFILAPNLTVYNKLIEDFSNTQSPKYVFQGIGEFAHVQPRIIKGDNYQEQKTQQYYLGGLIESSVNINIFNISKINSEVRGGKAPRIKRLSEYIGESYYDYLVSLPDLVLIMDESHHYRADRGMEVINELKPILGLELTATPQVEKNGGAIKFKNVVFEYSLAKAIKDGFVKEPAVATRKDFDPYGFSPEDLDRIKLEDGIRIHEDTKISLDIWARDNDTFAVKPFVLVVAKDTEHAGKLMQLMRSPVFFEGKYADKIMEIHSNQSGSEKEENIQNLLSLEDPENKIEIVIHVNMLKEGWDVTNLYTIIPLRTAASLTLREQTIGRGLRLPYGKRTGDLKADKLTIIAHDKFQEIIDEANKPDSIIRKENIIIIDEEELGKGKELVISKPLILQHFEEEQKKIEAIENPAEKKSAEVNLEARKLIHEILPEINREVKNVNDLKTESIREKVKERILNNLTKSPQMIMFTEDIIEEVEKTYSKIIEDFISNIIEIPRIVLQQSNNVISGFKDFDLEVKNLNYQPTPEEIIRKTLREQEGGFDTITGRGGIIDDSPERMIVNELINYSEIDYDEQSDLLYKLAGQAVEKLNSYLEQQEILNVIQNHKKDIGKNIHLQMMEHHYIEAPEYEEPVVLPFTKIWEWNYQKYSADKIHGFTETIEPSSLIPSKVFMGFKKSCHSLYQFDSKTEKDFAIILESELNTDVQKWMRPAPKQFQIYWDRNSKQYWPDFVVETNDTIYMVETKSEKDIDSEDVKEKAKAALEYCRYATSFTTKNGGKPWKYLLIPHGQVKFDKSLSFFVQHFEVIQENSFK